MEHRSDFSARMFSVVLSLSLSFVEIISVVEECFLFSILKIARLHLDPLGSSNLDFDLDSTNV